MVLTRRRSMLLSAPTLPTPSVATPSPSSSSRCTDPLASPGRSLLTFAIFLAASDAADHPPPSKQLTLWQQPMPLFFLLHRLRPTRLSTPTELPWTTRHKRLHLVSIFQSCCRALPGRPLRRYRTRLIMSSGKSVPGMVGRWCSSSER